MQVQAQRSLQTTAKQVVVWRLGQKYVNGGGLSKNDRPTDGMFHASRLGLFVGVQLQGQPMICLAHLDLPSCIFPSRRTTVAV